MLAQLAEPARVIALDVELEQELAWLRLPRRIRRAMGSYQSGSFISLLG
jgi:hypothetical protein